MGATVFFQSANELATLSNTFAVSGTPTDPTAVTLTVTSPSLVVTTFTWPSPATLTHGTAGVFSRDVPCGEAGEWQYLWEGTTAASDAAGGTWTVQETAVGKLYATVEALKSRVGITDTVDDYELHEACFAASRAVEQACDRHFWRTATGTVRTVEPTHGMYQLKLPAFHDLVSVSALATDSGGDGVFETSWAATDYQLLPYNPSAAPEVRPYTSIKAVGTQSFPLVLWYGHSFVRSDRVQITGVWGWPAVPKAIKQASLIYAEELFKLKDAPFGVAGFGDLGVVRIRDNPKVASLIGPYRRSPILVG